MMNRKQVKPKASRMDRMKVWMAVLILGMCSSAVKGMMDNMPSQYGPH